MPEATAGRKRADPCAAKMEALRRRHELAEAELVTAREIIEVQGKVSALLDGLLEPRSAPESTER